MYKTTAFDEMVRNVRLHSLKQMKEPNNSYPSPSTYRDIWLVLLSFENYSTEESIKEFMVGCFVKHKIIFSSAPICNYSIQVSLLHTIYCTGATLSCILLAVRLLFKTSVRLLQALIHCFTSSKGL